MDERLSWTDSAFWHLESPVAPMHLGALAAFGSAEGVAPEHVARLVRERAGRIPRLSRRVAAGWNPLSAPRWVQDPSFDTGRHVRLHRLDNDGDGCALASVAADLMAVPLNPHLPPWELHVLAGAGGRRPAGNGGDDSAGFAVLFKAHHAAMDGLRAVDIGARLLDQYQCHPGRIRRARRERNGPGGAPPALLGSLAARSGQLLEAARVAASVAAAGLNAALRQGAQPLHSPPTGRFRLALPRLALNDVNRIRKEHGGTVNDILLAVIAAALRTWLIEQGRSPAPGLARVLVPVSSRLRAGPGTGANQLSGYLLDLPVHVEDPLARLRITRDAMREHKDRGPRQGAGAVALLAGLLPPIAGRLSAPVLRHSAPLLFDSLVTNVPVLDVPLSLAGAPLRALHPIAPLAHGHTVAIAMTTYRNTVHLGIRTTGSADPGHIGEAAEKALTELLHADPPR